MQQLDVETIFLEESLVIGDPDAALTGGDGRPVHAHFHLRRSWRNVQSGENGYRQRP